MDENWKRDFKFRKRTITCLLCITIGKYVVLELCMYACMHVCMYVYIYIYIYIHRFIYVTGFVKIDQNHTGTEIHFIIEQ